jgi:hypothetical protein
MSRRVFDDRGEESSDDDMDLWHPGGNRVVVKTPKGYQEHLNPKINLKEFPDLRKGLTPSKTTAEGQWKEKTYRDELKMHKHITVLFSKIRHIRTREDAENFGGEFIAMASACQSDYWLIGLDTEESGCTAHIASIEGKKQCYQVWQLYNNRYNHCTKHGPPQALINILTHKKAVFVGKLVRGDIEKICKKLQIKGEQKHQIKFIALTKVYSWCQVMANSSSKLRG